MENTTDTGMVSEPESQLRLPAPFVGLMYISPIESPGGGMRIFRLNMNIIWTS